MLSILCVSSSKGGDTRELQSRMVPPPPKKKKLGRVTLSWLIVATMWSYCILILEQKKKHCWLLALSSHRNVVFSELTKLYPTHACREHNYVWPLLAQNCGYRWVFVAWDSIRCFWGNKEKREKKRADSDSEFSLFYDVIVSCKQIALPHRFSLSTVLLFFFPTNFASAREK